MDHDRPIDLAFIFVWAAVLEIKALRQLEVELDCSALERAFEGIFNGDVDLGAVECSVAGVDLPFAGLEALERFLQLLERKHGEAVSQRLD